MCKGKVSALSCPTWAQILCYAKPGRRSTVALKADPQGKTWPGTWMEIVPVEYAAAGASPALPEQARQA
jgi:hypothetical protein